MEQHYFVDYGNTTSHVVAESLGDALAQLWGAERAADMLATASTQGRETVVQVGCRKAYITTRPM